MAKEKPVKKKSDKPKKPIFKRWWFWVIVVVLVIGAIGGSGNKDSGQSSTSPAQTEAPAETPAPTEAPVPDPTEAPAPAEPATPQEIIEQTIRDRISEKYTYTDVDRITINENLGSDAQDDYIALVYVTWTQKNSGKTSKEVLKMYSDDLAATIAENCENVQELAVFWTVPYLNDANAKCAYERKNGGMYEMDMMWGAAFNG